MALVALLAMGVALAQSVVIHPFGGQDLGLGAAVAERAANALSESGVDVYGPEIAPTLVPPLVVPDGFLNPAALLGAGGVDTLTGAELLRDTLGADVAVTGDLHLREAELVLDLFVSDISGPSARVRISAPEDAPAVLASRVAREIARRIGAPRPDPVGPFELTGGFGDYARAVTLVGAGFVVQARDLLRDSAELPEAGAGLLADLEAALGDAEPRDPVRAAVFSLAREDFQPEETAALFEAFANERPLPAAMVWQAVLAASAGDEEVAAAAFEEAAERYPYGRASQANWRHARGIASVEPADLLVEPDIADDAASLLAVALLAESAGNIAVEKDALQSLAREAPFFTYPFERLSFIAFDQDDPLAAAQALVVAVDLAPESDLYWTNLGWAYYLLGFLERSQEASERAVALDPAQYIARYNLGLVHAVRNDLEAAMPEYAEALQFDPEVDDEAIADLENARALYPDAPSVHYALGFLYAAEGRRGEAADAYDAYLTDVEATGRAPTSFVERARRQLEVLRAPPAPLEISDGASLLLGASGEPAAPYHPGDPLTPLFELYTPGDALPPSVDVTLTIVGPGGEPVASAQATISIPTGAIGYVVDDLRLEVPVDAQPGDYRMEIEATAQNGRMASISIPFEVAGESVAMRWLLGRGIEMRSLGSGTALYAVEDLPRAPRLADLLLGELQASAESAASAIPEVEAGRFEGLDGGEVFRQSTIEDVQAFLAWLRSEGTVDVAFPFVEAYAQWAVEGAPTP